MVRKHYGRWISKDTKSMADIVSKTMGFEIILAIQKK